jgi:DEAD/DEAH box helicase domain-containing protein
MSAPVVAYNALMDTAAFLAWTKRRPWYGDQLVHVEEVPGREAVFQDTQASIHPLLSERLQALGITRLYRHQAQALDALAEGKNVVVSTPAATGKSLCYHIPALTAALEDRLARALYLYPTKALAQDQLRHLHELVPPGAKVHCAIYDGDTPKNERSGVRARAQVLLTNPDMLHLGILPNHRMWARLFQGLRYVVVDEAHVYRGVFGSHTANLLRRLRRVCARYGASPQFVLCSATIGNPREHAEALTGLPFVDVREDGAPSGGKTFAFWNPPVEDEQKGTRKSAGYEATQLFSELLRQRVRSLTFVRTRRQAELVYRNVTEQLRQHDPELAGKVAPYRGAYLPEDRRRIERDLFEGRLTGVVTTNALELGVDIGKLDATVLAGYPGTIASTWQQAGRSGRSGTKSLSVLVARNDPLDQYLMRHPEFFFGRSPEQALVAPENPYILKPHLLCAAYEAPLTPQDAALFGASFKQCVDELAEAELLRQGKDGWFPDTRIAYPAEAVLLRSEDATSYVVAEEESGRVLEQGISESSAYAQLHPGAVYLHQGEAYLVSRLDRATGIAYVGRTDAPYYTVPRETTDIRILRTFKQKPALSQTARPEPRSALEQSGATNTVRPEPVEGPVPIPTGATVFFGEVEVTSQVLGFRKLAQYEETVLGDEPLDLPPHHYRTMALWYDLPEDARKGVMARREDLAGGLHAMEHAAIGVLPLFALCDRRDIGGVSTPLHPDTGTATVFIYDGHPGGVGIAERGYERIEELWRATLDVIANCPCESGCPGCIHSPKCGNNNHPLDKVVAAALLRALLGIQG